MGDPDRSQPPPVIQTVNQFQVSPPPGSVPTTDVPLTFLDVPWLLCRPMQRLFFYHLPPTHCPTTLHFTQTILPNLTSSLSLSLQRFFPLASSLISPSPRGKPFIRYTEGDSVPFTLAESTAPAYFDQLFANHPRCVRELHAFVPDLPPVRTGQDGARVVPLLAVKVTVFPGAGVCVGVQFRHVAADGVAFNQFMKSWAYLCRTGGGGGLSSAPCLDRELVRDPCGLEPILLEEWWNCASAWDYNFTSTDQCFENKVRATFVISVDQINRLKDFVCHQSVSMEKHVGRRLSTFVVACAFIWVTMIKSKEKGVRFDPDDDDKKPMCHLGFVADCRHRLEPKLPETYFGNCLDICFVSINKSVILGENGLVEAANAIGDRVKQLESGVLKGAKRWMLDWKQLEEEGGITTVAGSPKLRVYDTDFGWGRPKKSELVQIDVSGAIYISESRDGGGVEIGLALSTDEMDLFSSIVEEVLQKI